MHTNYDSYIRKTSQGIVLVGLILSLCLGINNPTTARAHKAEFEPNLIVPIQLSSNSGLGNASPSILPKNTAENLFNYGLSNTNPGNPILPDPHGSDETAITAAAIGTTTRVSVESNGTQGNGDSAWPSISAEGQYVVFASTSSNLVSGDTNGVSDVFVHDQITGQTERISVASDGTQGNLTSYSSSISDDGRYVAFWSWATNMITRSHLKNG